MDVITAITTNNLNEFNMFVHKKPSRIRTNLKHVLSAVASSEYKSEMLDLIYDNFDHKLILESLLDLDIDTAVNLSISCKSFDREITSRALGAAMNKKMRANEPYYHFSKLAFILSDKVCDVEIDNLITCTNLLKHSVGHRILPH